MKKSTFLILITVSYFIAVGKEKEERRLAFFNSVHVEDGIKLELRKGNKRKALIESNNVSLDNVSLESVDGILTIRLKESSQKKIDVTVYLTYVSLEELTCGSAAMIFSNEVIEGENLKIVVNNAGKVELQMHIQELRANVNNAGKLYLSGTATKQDIVIRNASRFYGRTLTGQSVVVDSSSGGIAEVFALNFLKVKATRGGKVKYGGNPSKKDILSKSGGSIKRIKT